MKVKYKEFNLATSAADFATIIEQNLITICHANGKWVVWYKESAEWTAKP